MISSYCLCQEVDDNAPIFLESTSDEWNLIEQIWDHIPIKYYSLQVGSGTPTNRRLLYINPKKESISYQIKTNMPHLVLIKNNSLILGKDEGMYIKFQINPPKTPCKLKVKFVIYDVIEGVPVDGIEMELNVKNV